MRQQQLRSVQSRVRSHLTYNAKKKILELYGLEQEAILEEIRKQIKILLARDQFTCASDRREVSRVAWKTQLRRSGSNEIQSCGFCFRAQEAIEFIHCEFYNGQWSEEAWEPGQGLHCEDQYAVYVPDLHSPVPQPAVL